MKRVIKKSLFALAFVAVFALAIGIVMWLWNLIIPSVIGWTAINYWQAGGLMLLSRLLFGGFWGGRHRHKGRHFWKDCHGRGHGGDHGHRGGHAFWHKKLHEQMKGMSKEERRDFIRQRMREEHDNHHHGFEDQGSPFGKRPDHEKEDEQA